MNDNFKLFFKWFIWIIILLLGIMFVYWFSDAFNSYNEYLSSFNNWNDVGPIKPDSFTKYFKLGPFVIIIGILLLLYSTIYLIYEIIKKFNIKIQITKKALDCEETNKNKQ